MPRERDKRYVQVEGTTATWPPAGGGELPVGSVYMNATDPTDPATLLGYGTWERVDAETWV